MHRQPCIGFGGSPVASATGSPFSAARCPPSAPCAPYCIRRVLRVLRALVAFQYWRQRQRQHPTTPSIASSTIASCRPVHCRHCRSFSFIGSSGCWTGHFRTEMNRQCGCPSSSQPHISLSALRSTTIVTIKYPLSNVRLLSGGLWGRLQVTEIPAARTDKPPVRKHLATPSHPGPTVLGICRHRRLQSSGYEPGVVIVAIRHL